MQNNAHAHVINGTNGNNIRLTKLTHKTGEFLKSIEEFKSELKRAKNLPNSRMVILVIYVSTLQRIF